MIAAHIEGWLPEVLDMERLFGSARPYGLDDATVERTLRV
jgi:hypothetical protein